MSKKLDQETIVLDVDVDDLIEETELPVEPEDAVAEKKPEPKPGDAAYDWAPHYPPGTDLYRHTFPNGTVIELRAFGGIYSQTFLYKLRKAQTDSDIFFAAIDRGACDVAQAVLESMDAPIDSDPIQELWDAWSQAGTAHVEGAEGLSTGESRG